MSGIYLHIPFCGSKCLYCSFYSEPFQKQFAQNYPNAIISEFLNRQNEIPNDVETIYFGGGTPSKLKDEDLCNILQSVADKISGGIKSLKEITLEVNPEDVTADRAEKWASYGFNRISMGVQSFNDATLKSIGRRHDSQRALDAYNILRCHFSNISLDLICGLPESMDDWNRSIDKTIQLRPEHISAYILETDNNSVLAKLHKSGKVVLPDEDEIRPRFSRLIERVTDAGYLQYEISNFAIPGFESKHNSSYWLGKPYLGLGPSASSYDGSFIRRTNDSDVIKYISSGGKCSFFQEILNGEQKRMEYLLTRLRTKQGIDLTEYERMFGTESTADLTQRVSVFLDSGDIEFSGKNFSLTHKGIFIEDFILSQII